ncbi:hypothetical protein EBN03_18180 [Nocardia stercoris]|uniref:Uncharacterized protein n=1 Tax=Nocardia stercoris TaxID=2483361 RepID=A0A3M2L465_9NOCA|nr:hypothetical protein EBN03_18180 [Nocardia stercoris]
MRRLPVRHRGKRAAGHTDRHPVGAPGPRIAHDGVMAIRIHVEHVVDHEYRVRVATGGEPLGYPGEVAAAYPDFPAALHRALDG